MKRILLLAIIFTSGIIMLSSCASSRRGTGCPTVAGVIHQNKV